MEALLAMKALQCGKWSKLNKTWEKSEKSEVNPSVDMDQFMSEAVTFLEYF